MRRAIIARELKPGEHVWQEVVAERLGVSRVPVREALKVLTAEGQLVYEAHRGYTVTKLSLEELEEIYLMRCLLESEAIRRAAPGIDDEFTARLGALVEEMDRLSEAGDILGLIERNREFHLSLFERAGMPRLYGTIKVLWQNSDPYRSVFFNDPASRRRAQEEHRLVLEACERRNAEEIIATMDIHRTNAIADLAIILKEVRESSEES